MNRNGYSTTAEYRAWANMKGRCLNREHPEYKNYGGRGISVDIRWYVFENFLNDMGKCPPGLTLERKDNSDWYSKENCKWATMKEQQNNKRNNLSQKIFLPTVPRRIPSFQVPESLILALAVADFPSLSHMQREVLNLVWAGLCAKEIAEKLGISPKGVDYHIKSLRDKWGSFPLIALCRIGLVRGYLSVD